MKKSFCILMVFIGLAGNLLSQNPEWLHYTYGGHVSSIAEENGYLWVATCGGLVKLDKSTGVKEFYYATISGSCIINFSSIAVDENGTKWIGTWGEGLVSFNGSEWSVFNTSNSGLPNDWVTSIAADNEGTLWIGTANGLAAFNGSGWTVYDASNSILQCVFVNSIVIDTDGTKWIGMGDWPPNGVLCGMLASFDGTSWTNCIDDMYIKSLAIQQNGIIWIGTINQGLLSYDGSTWTYYDIFNSGLPSMNVLSISIDSSGTKWIGTDEGLAAYDGSTWTIYNTSNSGLPENEITATKVDQSGTLYTGTYSKSLASFDGSGWTIHNTSNSGMPGNDVRSIAIGPDGEKWIGMSKAYSMGIPVFGEGGLAMFDGANWVTYTSEDSGLPDNDVQVLAMEPGAGIWIGMRQGGLARFDGTVWSVYNTENSGLPSDDVWKLAIDQDGTKWIGTFGSGLARFNGFNWTVYNTSNSEIPEDIVKALAVDSNGTVWIAASNAYGGGLAAFDGTNWTVYYTYNSGLPSYQITSIAIDANNMLWLGTWDTGLVTFDGDEWTVYDTGNSGLPENNIMHVSIDQDGIIWIGTVNSGLVKFDGTEWTIYKTSNSGLLADRISSVATDLYGTKWIRSRWGIGLTAFNENGIPVHVKENFSAAMWAYAFPNPASDRLNIRLNLDNTGPVQITVLNITGQQISKISEANPIAGEYLTNINISGWPAGIYFCKVQSGEAVAALKIVKQ